MVNTERAFSRLYDTEAVIERASSSYSYGTRYEELGRVYADIQPVGNGGKRLDFGIYEGCTAVMYCQNTDKLKAGVCIRAEGRRYIVTAVERRRIGTKAYLKED